MIDQLQIFILFLLELHLIEEDLSLQLLQILSLTVVSGGHVVVLFRLLIQI